MWSIPKQSRTAFFRKNKSPCSCVCRNDAIIYLYIKIVVNYFLNIIYVYFLALTRFIFSRLMCFMIKENGANG